jgi:hypothetical protein
VTIPQILSGIGYPLFSVALLFLILHTFNLMVPGIDYYIPSSEFPWLGYVVAFPALLVGFVLGMVGSFWESIQEKMLERDRD